MTMPDAPEPRAPIVLGNLFARGDDWPTLPWQPFRDGVRIHRLYGDGNRGPAAALLLFERGALIPLHRHVAYEHAVVLWREPGALHAPPVGTLLLQPPGSQHEVRIASRCIVLLIWHQPVEFINE